MLREPSMSNSMPATIFDQRRSALEFRMQNAAARIQLFTATLAVSESKLSKTDATSNDASFVDEERYTRRIRSDESFKRTTSDKILSSPRCDISNLVIDQSRL